MWGKAGAEGGGDARQIAHPRDRGLGVWPGKKTRHHPRYRPGRCDPKTCRKWRLHTEIIFSKNVHVGSEPPTFCCLT